MAGEAATAVHGTPLAKTTQRMDILTAPSVEPVNGETEEKIHTKKRKKKEDVEEGEAPESGADGGEKKKKKKKKIKAEE